MLGVRQLAGVVVATLRCMLGLYVLQRVLLARNKVLRQYEFASLEH